MNKPFIPVVLGTAREGRRSEVIAKFVYDIVKSDERIETQFIDVKDFVKPYTIASWVESAEAQPWRDIAARANAFIIVTPEYNHEYPGELKLLLDQAYKQYEKKPVVTCGVSASDFGGVRVVESLLSVYGMLKMIVVPMPLYFTKVEDLIKDSTKLKNDYKEKAKTMLDTLLGYIN